MPTEQLSTFILPWDWHLWARARGLQDGPRWIDGWIGEWSSCKSFILEKRHESWCNCVFFLGFQCISIEGQRARPENINHCSMTINQTVF